jgi:hypothetical protein
MTDEATKPSLLQGIKAHWRCCALGVLFILVFAGLGCLAYHGWQLKTELAQQNAQLNLAINDLSQQEKQQASAIATQKSNLDAWQAKQQQITKQVQGLTLKNLSGSSMGGVLSNLTNQVTVIQLLITNQQYSLAVNLLATMEAELALLPEQQRQTLMAAVEADRERIQNVQTAVQQLLGQLQQLQQHINQQLLTHFGPASPEVKEASAQAPAANSNMDSFFEQVKQQLTQAVQIQHITSANNPALPAFYSGVMLQLALYQAQFALTQGNWMEFQLALTAVQAWLNPSTLAWLPDMASVMQTVASLSQQPPAFSAVNVNATQQALIKITQELAA